MARKQAVLDEQEMRKLSTVKHPTMVVVKDESGHSLNAVIIFVRSGDSTNYAEELAAGELRSPLTETYLINLPDDFNVDDYGLYWDQPYSG